VERFNPGILEIEKIVKEPRFIECHRNAPFQPRGTEVGVVLDLMIHDLDIILYLVSSPVASLEAVGATILSKHEDIANARIKFKSRLYCQYYHQPGQPGQDAEDPDISG